MGSALKGIQSFFGWELCLKGVHQLKRVGTLSEKQEVQKAGEKEQKVYVKNSGVFTTIK